MHYKMLSKVVFSLSFIALLITGCSSNEKESRSMETIYKEEGVPVKVEKVEPSAFENEFMYNAVLSGINESSRYALISERVESIKANVGDYVQKGQLIITFPSDNPSAKYSQAKFSYENSKSTYERYKSIYETGGISKQDLDNAQTQFEVAQADYDAVSQMVRVTAPISGYITNIAVKETENVNQDQLLFTVGNTSALKANIDVGESEISDVHMGQKAYATWMGNTIEGKVTRVAMSMNPDTKSFNTIIEFKNSDGKIKAGVTANIKIEKTYDKDKIITERKNLVNEGDKYYVYVAQNGTARKVNVEIGEASGLEVEITKGLSEGENLITQGQMLLSDGSKIRIIGEGE